MFQWSKKVVKSVTFDPGVADESLLALVESYLEKDPDKTFSDLCKEALWQSLCVPESVKPTPKPAATSGMEQQIAALKSQITDLEERFFAKESHRLETIESHLLQLSQQVAQLAIIVNQSSVSQSPTPSVPTREVVNTTPTFVNATASYPVEDDPVISRLSQYLDDF
ncbi:plasmid segregation centromere-binding protein ParR [Iningainema tapete]|uniref:Plasmid segregation centromere-binding protein ParR n=1 Tax=Iningainema tapete BLCC-T55 TaxID=2748662 RepID=A0A8J7BX99_9CYAN|nr:plasmid segregation centromere-binding protein ParR [Iningainema tapete]MBD2773402.1 plasmid segregation centromere-binding protein ParR [Iningainema tapete BLCC-T55]